MTGKRQRVMRAGGCVFAVFTHDAIGKRVVLGRQDSESPILKDTVVVAQTREDIEELVRALQALSVELP